MKAIVWRGQKTVHCESIDQIESASNETLIKVSKAGICGSDLTIINGLHPRARYPLVPGHEFTGRIEKLPDRYTGRLEIGQRVVVDPLISCGECRICKKGYEHICQNIELIGVERNPGAFSEYINVPVIKHIIPIPDEVSDDAAALTEPLSVAIHAVNYSECNKDDYVLIYGAGPIGLLIAQVLRNRGTKNITIIEVKQSSIRRATNMGFNVIDGNSDGIEAELLNITNNNGFDLIFDAAGASSIFNSIFKAISRFGRIIMVALHKNKPAIDLRALSYNENRIIGTRIYTIEDFREAVDLLAMRAIDFNSLITHRFDIEQAEEAFKIFEVDSDVCKVVINIG